jgi:hypothetical protein
MEYTQEQLKKDLNQILQHNQQIVDLMFVGKPYYARDFPKIIAESKKDSVNKVSSKEIRQNIFVANFYRPMEVKDVNDNDVVIYIRALDDQNNLWLSTFSFGNAGFLDDVDNYARRLFYQELFKVDRRFLTESDPEMRKQIELSYKMN